MPNRRLEVDWKRLLVHPIDKHGAERARVQIRVDAINMLVSIGINADAEDDETLAELFGFKGYLQLAQAMEVDADLCRRVEMLGGPNGPVIFKAMKAKNG